jgi:acetyl-CoA acetyltransferase
MSEYFGSVLMRDVAVVSYCRTGIAKAQRGALNQTHGIAMAAHVMKAAVARAKIEVGEIEDIVLGCGLPKARPDTMWRAMRRCSRALAWACRA